MDLYCYYLTSFYRVSFAKKVPEYNLHIFFQLAVGAVLGGAIYLLFKSKEILGFHIDIDLTPGNPTAIYFSLILIIIVVFGFLLIFTFLGKKMTLITT